MRPLPPQQNNISSIPPHLIPPHRQHPIIIESIPARRLALGIHMSRHRPIMATGWTSAHMMDRRHDLVVERFPLSALHGQLCEFEPRFVGEEGEVEGEGTLGEGDGGVDFLGGAVEVEAFDVDDEVVGEVGEVDLTLFAAVCVGAAEFLAVVAADRHVGFVAVVALEPVDEFAFCGGDAVFVAGNYEFELVEGDVHA